jgi:4-oxalocrotonate tautomerase
VHRKPPGEAGTTHRHLATLPLPTTKENTMPYILIQVTDDGVTNEQKEAMISGATDLMVKVLNKDPEATFVVIDEVNTDNWGWGGEVVTKRRQRQAAEAAEAKKAGK